MARIDRLLKKHQEFTLETRVKAELLLRQRHPERAVSGAWVQNAEDFPNMERERDPADGVE